MVRADGSWASMDLRVPNAKEVIRTRRGGRRGRREKRSGGGQRRRGGVGGDKRGHCDWEAWKEGRREGQQVETIGAANRLWEGIKQRVMYSECYR